MATKRSAAPRSAAPTRSGTRKKTAPKRARSRASRKPSLEAALSRMAWAVIWGVLGIICLLGLLPSDGFLLEAIRRGMRALFGVGAYTLPFALLGLSALLVLQRNGAVRLRGTCLLLLPLLLGSLMHSFISPYSYDLSVETLTELIDSGIEGASGGLLSGTWYVLLEWALSKLGALLVLLALTVTALLVALHIHPKTLLTMLLPSDDWYDGDDGWDDDEDDYDEKPAALPRRSQTTPSQPAPAEYAPPPRPPTTQSPRTVARSAGAARSGGAGTKTGSRRRLNIDIPLDDGVVGLEDSPPGSEAGNGDPSGDMSSVLDIFSTPRDTRNGRLNGNPNSNPTGNPPAAPVSDDPDSPVARRKRSRPLAPDEYLSGLRALREQDRIPSAATAAPPATVGDKRERSDRLSGSSAKPSARKPSRQAGSAEAVSDLPGRRTPSAHKAAGTGSDGVSDQAAARTMDIVSGAAAEILPDTAAGSAPRNAPEKAAGNVAGNAPGNTMGNRAERSVEPTGEPIAGTAASAETTSSASAAATATAATATATGDGTLADIPIETYQETFTEGEPHGTSEGETASADEPPIDSSAAGLGADEQQEPFASFEAFEAFVAAHAGQEPLSIDQVISQGAGKPTGTTPASKARSGHQTGKPGKAASGKAASAAPAEQPPFVESLNHKDSPAPSDTEEQGALNAEMDKSQKTPVPLYDRPSLDLLDQGQHTVNSNAEAELRENSTCLMDTLQSFGIHAKVIGIVHGPSVTRFELTIPRGIKISRIVSLSDDIALSLGAMSVRIAPIPDKSAVGIEVPNKTVHTVYIRECIGSPAFARAESPVSFAVGKDITGRPVIGDIAKMPHMLIAGTTGSGKSVCINSLLVSLLYKSAPEEVRLIMVDPKMVELGNYNGIPHLLIPVVTDPKKAAGALNWAVGEMERRYKLFAHYQVRNLAGYNAFVRAHKAEWETTEGIDMEEHKVLPQIVIVIDELADLMMVAAKEVETSICRIAQKARAAGMHLVVATQRPSADVITGIMKANIPSRIAFAVASQVESRIILDTNGAEKLIGRGDMLYAPLGEGKPMRVQGCFISSEEIEAVIAHIKQTSNTEYNEEILEHIERQAEETDDKSGHVAADESEDEDTMIEEAIDLIMECQQASTSMLQRRLKLGYARAGRIMDQLESRGIVGASVGSKPRQILISREEWQERKLRSQDLP